MNVSSCIDRRFSILVKEGDEIFHIWRNKRSELFTFCQCLPVLEDQFIRGDNFSRDHNLLLESENPGMKFFKLFYIIEGQGGYSRLNTTINPSKVRGK